MARISPDGKWFSYLAPVDGILNVWVGPIDDPSKAKAVTDDKERDIRGFRWAYNSKQILYSQDKKGDENWHVYATDVGNGRDERPDTPGRYSRSNSRDQQRLP